ncbi:MAG: hypothetical protein GWO24_02420, partial [Akkermansiaceae bacterium]|nr:hypothetical protein [Akkermansiaceae bacterium]
REFTITNLGEWELNVSALTVPDGFQATGGTGTIPPNGSFTFELALTAAEGGQFGGEVNITSDDPGQGVFSFPVRGTVLAPP